MKLSQFKYNLPKELIAEVPAKQRDESRLLVVNRATGTIEDKMFKYLSKDDYLRKAKAVATNISDKNNVDFINDILNGRISEDEIPKMDARSMASKNKKKEIKQQQNNMFDSIRSDWDLIHAPVFEGMHTCRQCGKKRTKTQEFQMRSSDEPMTLFITCLTCGNKWKI
jgi:S-adenosylmethionine:tRNA-ribosyltransferase-isomerase (queuine synthetase)